MFRGDKYGFTGSVVSRWGLEGNTALKWTFTAQYGEGTPGGAVKSKFRTEDTKLLSLPHLHFH